MINFVISKVKLEEFVVSEEELGNHHCSVSLYFVHVKVEGLQICALFESFSEILSSFTLYVVSLQVEVQQSWRLRDEITKCLCTYISDLIVTQVNLFNINRVPFKRCTNDDKMVIGYAIREHLFVVSWNGDVDRVIFVVSFFKVLHKGVMRFESCLLRLFLVELNNISLDEFSIVNLRLLVLHVFNCFHCFLLIVRLNCLIQKL